MKTIYNILDFETTGFNADCDRVIEVGVVKVENNKVIESYQELINPEMSITPEITRLTGISNNMVSKADSSLKVMPRLKEFLNDELIIAHNASFDSRFFYAEMRRAHILATNKFLCSLLLARRIYQNLHTHKLSALCDHLGFINEASHRALGDAKATQKVFSSLCEEIKTLSKRQEIDYEFLIGLNKVPKKKVVRWLARTSH